MLQDNKIELKQIKALKIIYISILFESQLN